RFPPGDYLVNTGTLSWGQGCQPISMVHGTLTARCLNYFGNLALTTLDHADKCVGGSKDIMDVNGWLRCVVSSQQAWSYVADVISISSDVKTPAGETRVIRIDQPRVDIPIDEFNGPGARRIHFDTGDVVTVIDAGGCVQTGGMGSTWKSYVYPQGNGQETYYSGQLWIPNATGAGLTRIAALLNHPYTVSPSGGPLASANQFLYLGYEDEPGDYTDNGYYSHDNGNNDQCAGVGPAWVTIKIFRPTNPNIASGPPVWFPPNNLPFDLTWNENMPGDNNGLPLDPEWAYQIGQSPQAYQPNPDFQQSCASAINQNSVALIRAGNTGSSPINAAQLARTCTGDDPITDLDQGWVWFGGLCPSDPLDGHLDWGIVTYTGQLEWREYSGGWPQDGDYNFGLETPDNGHGETDISDSGYPGIGMEFDSGETIDYFNSGWWNTFANASDDSRSDMVDGQNAIVTGLMGIDGVHGGYSEIHPVYAMAVETSESASGGGVDQTWAFFIRNMGDEGECSSSNAHVWPGLDNNTYSIQFPVPTYATKVTLNDSATSVNSVVWTSAAPSGPNLSFDGAWTYAEFQIPLLPMYVHNLVTGDVMYGQIGLHYSFMTSGGSSLHAVHRHRESFARKQDHDLDWTSIESRISDLGERRAFDADLRAIHIQRVPPRYMRMSFDRTIHVRTADFKPRKAMRVRDVQRPDPYRTALYKAETDLLQKYKPYITTVPIIRTPLTVPRPTATPGD
ncbi:MAG TPA: hypothetical protein VEJ20_05760, partial [Candidatus Eremiobacteraceae bacterium]|nr:hypothetical protein [Candidatus Eremiobacteraceae bacterium]